MKDCDKKNNAEAGEGEGPLGSRAEEIAKCGYVAAKQAGRVIHCLSIIGQIEGHYILDQNQKTTKYEHLIPLLCAVEESEDIHGLLLILNTMGGDVEAGLAIAETVASMKTPTVTLVLGGGHSIGVPLAVSGRRSFIVPSATMTLHPVRTSGTIIGVPQTFYYFDKMQDRIVNFICSHSHADESHLRAMMNNTSELANDVGTIIDGCEAVACGLIDEIGGLADALDALKSLIDNDTQNAQKKTNLR